MGGRGGAYIASRACAGDPSPTWTGPTNSYEKDDFNIPQVGLSVIAVYIGFKAVSLLRDPQNRVPLLQLWNDHSRLIVATVCFIAVRLHYRVALSVSRPMASTKFSILTCKHRVDTIFMASDAALAR